MEATVNGLLLRRGPPAIIGRIWTIIIDTVERMLCGWALAHIVYERPKIVTPLFADINTSCPIQSIAAVLRLLAPSDHIVPSLKKRMTRGFASAPFCGRHVRKIFAREFCSIFLGKTPAAFYVPFPEFWPKREFLVPAPANTPPLARTIPHLV